MDNATVIQKPPRKSLVLSRRIGETIELTPPHGAEPITVELTARRGGKINIRILAETAVAIRRGELPPQQNDCPKAA